MASWVDAGPGRRLQAAMPSSNSVADIHCRSSTHSLRRRAMWVGGPPNPMHPIRPHSRAMVVRRTGSLVAMHREERLRKPGRSGPTESPAIHPSGARPSRRARYGRRGQSQSTSSIHPPDGPCQAPFRYVGGARTRPPI